MAPKKKRSARSSGSIMRLDSLNSPNNLEQPHPGGTHTEQPDVVSSSATSNLSQGSYPHSSLLEQGSSQHSRSEVDRNTAALSPSPCAEPRHSSDIPHTDSEPQADPIVPLNEASPGHHELLKGAKGRRPRTECFNGATTSVERYSPHTQGSTPQKLACWFASFSPELCQFDGAPYEGACSLNELMDHLFFSHMRVGHVDGLVTEPIRQAMRASSRKNKATGKNVWRDAFCLIFPLYGIERLASSLCPDQGKPLLANRHQEDSLRSRQIEAFRSQALDFISHSPTFCPCYTAEQIRFLDVGDLLKFQVWIGPSRQLDTLYSSLLTPVYKTWIQPQMMEEEIWAPLEDSEMDLSPTMASPHNVSNTPTAILMSGHQSLNPSSAMLNDAYPDMYYNGDPAATAMFQDLEMAGHFEPTLREDSGPMDQIPNVPPWSDSALTGSAAYEQDSFSQAAWMNASSSRFPLSNFSDQVPIGQAGYVLALPLGHPPQPMAPFPPAILPSTVENTTQTNSTGTLAPADQRRTQNTTPPVEENLGLYNQPLRRAGAKDCVYCRNCKQGPIGSWQTHCADCYTSLRPPRS